MADHDGIDPGGNGGAEGREFDLIEARAAGIDARERQMGVGAGVSMAGKMLGRGHAASGVATANEGRDQLADLGGIFAKRARVDDGIVGIGVDVGVGIEVPMDSDGAGLGGGDASELVGVVGAAGGSDGHGVRKAGAALEAHGQAALEVGGKQQRQRTIGLQLVGKRGSVERTFLHQQATFDRRGDAEGAEVIGQHLVAQADVVGAFGVHELDPGPDHEELADLFLQRHPVQGAFGPAGACGVEVGGLFGRSRTRRGQPGQYQKNKDKPQSNAHLENHSTYNGKRHGVAELKRQSAMLRLVMVALLALGGCGVGYAATDAAPVADAGAAPVADARAAPVADAGAFGSVDADHERGGGAGNDSGRRGAGGT